FPDNTLNKYEQLRTWITKQSKESPIRIGFEANTPYNQVSRWMKALEGFQVQWNADEVLCDSFRLRKSGKEMKKLLAASELACAGFWHVITLLRPGVTEEEIASRMITFWMDKEPSSKPSFDIMVLFGENGSSPHRIPGKRKLSLGDSILIDFGVKLNGFCSDATRTFSFGTPSDQDFLKVWKIVAKAKRKATALFSKKATAYSFEKEARRVIQDGGYGDKFIHSLGHGLGALVHEAPRFNKEEPLAIDSCVTIEPGIYLPGRFGVRLEDSFIVGETGALIMNNLPTFPYWEMYKDTLSLQANHLFS
ncbi:M24 family metallopeptidase, partial [Candidatus Similichlamydia epinepheli]|uniref:M24 family metallopeptidase n=1 Tax=Candidatus Similichlamydia epinepheli TaxID=1903953 RepID=UPI000D3BA945